MGVEVELYGDDAGWCWSSGVVCVVVGGGGVGVEYLPLFDTPFSVSCSAGVVVL